MRAVLFMAPDYRIFGLFFIGFPANLPRKTLMGTSKQSIQAAATGGW
jgi:hypothetical protein